MSAWTRAPLGDLVSIVGGGTPSRNESRFFGGDIPWVTPKDMKSRDIFGSQVTISQHGLESSAARLIPSNSVLVVVRSGVLKHTLPVALSRVPVAINQDMKALICNERVHADYLARFVKAQSGTVLQWVRATTADNFPIEKLKGLAVPLPPLAEQRRIAEILDRADALRAKRRAALAQLDTLTQSIFLDMFGDLAASEWRMSTVREVARAATASIRTGPFGSQLLHSEFIDEGVAVLGIDNAVNNEFRWSGRRFISVAKYRQLVRYTVRPGDVLITIMGTCGRCAVVPDDIQTAINTKHLCCITLDATKCLPRFLHAYFLRHPIARSYLRHRAKGATMDGLNMGVVEELPVPLVPIHLQRAFVDQVSEIDGIRSAQRASLADLDALFASLQDRAFRGVL